MSTLKVNNLQVGQDSTATNNLTWFQPGSPDGTIRLGSGNAGSATTKFTFDKDGNLTCVGNINAASILAPIEGTLDDWIVHAGDTNTKFGFPANDQFSVETGGSERLRITSDGKLAIGNASPQQLLHVWPDTANTTSAYVRVTAGDRNSNTGIDIGQDASGDGHVNVVSNGTLTFSTNNSPRIKIAHNSAATAIGTNAAYNAMLTVRGDISGQLLHLKATEDTSRLMVSGTNSNGCEVNLYDDAGGQKGIMMVNQTEFSLKAPNSAANFRVYTTPSGGSATERLRILADGGTKFTRVTTGGAETVGNDPGKWFKIGTWAGSTVDAAARATITVIGAATHDSNSNVSGETKIHLAFSSNPNLYGYFYSTTAVRQGVAGVAHKYNSSTKSAEIWIKYQEGYSSTACNADVTNGFFTGENTNTGSTSTPSGATLLDSWWSVWTSNQTTSSRKLQVDGSGVFKHSPLGTFNEAYLKAEGNSTTYIQKFKRMVLLIQICHSKCKMVDH